MSFEPRGSIAGDLTQALTWFKASNGILITAGNAVTLETTGFVDNLANGSTEPLLGVAADTMRGDSSSTEIPVYCDPNQTFYNDTDASLTNANVGEAFRTVSASQIDGSVGAANSAASFILIKRDPDGDADLSKGLFKPYRTQLLSNKLNT